MHDTKAFSNAHFASYHPQVEQLLLNTYRCVGAVAPKSQLLH